MARNRSNKQETHDPMAPIPMDAATIQANHDAGDHDTGLGSCDGMPGPCVLALEADGLSTSDAQAVADADALASLQADSDAFDERSAIIGAAVRSEFPTDDDVLTAAQAMSDEPTAYVTDGYAAFATVDNVLALAAAMADEPTAYVVGSQDDDAQQEQDGTGTDGNAEAGPTADDNAQAFRDAYASALAEADPTTGTVPTDYTVAVVDAFRALRGNARATLPLTLSSEATASAMADPTAPNVGMLLAVGTLSTALATAPARAASEPRERDVVGDAARTVFVARWTERNALATLNPAQRADALATLGDPDAWDALAAMFNWSPPRGARKSSAPRTGSTGPRMAIAPHVAHALAAVAPGTVLTVAQIVAHDSTELGALGRVGGTVSPGAVTNAITRGDFGNVHAVAVTNASGTLSAKRVS